MRQEFEAKRPCQHGSFHFPYERLLVSQSAPPVRRSHDVLAALEEEAPFLNEFLGDFPAVRMPRIRPDNEPRLVVTYISIMAANEIDTQLMLTVGITVLDCVVTHCT